MEIVTLMVACAEHRVAPCTGAAIYMVGWHNGLGCSFDGSPGDLTPEDPIFDLDAERTLEALHDWLQLIFRGGIDVLEGQFAELVAVAVLSLLLTYTPLLFISRQPGTGLVH